MAQVTVKVNGQNFTLACDDGEEAHLATIRLLQKMPPLPSFFLEKLPPP